MIKKIFTIVYALGVCCGRIYATDKITTSDLNAGMAAAQRSVELFEVRHNGRRHAGRVLKTNTASPVRGNPAAKITLMEFGDFDCPNTAKMYSVVQELLRRHPSTLRFVFKMLPIDSHPQAFPAARRWAAVRLQAPDKAWAYFDGLFRGRLERKLGDAYYQQLAKELGLDEKKLNETLGSEEVAKILDADIKESSGHRVEGVPSFFLNGVLAEQGTVPIEFLDSKIIELERK